MQLNDGESSFNCTPEPTDDVNTLYSLDLKKYTDTTNFTWKKFKY